GRRAVSHCALGPERGVDHARVAGDRRERRAVGCPQDTRWVRYGQLRDVLVGGDTDDVKSRLAAGLVVDLHTPEGDVTSDALAGRAGVRHVSRRPEGEPPPPGFRVVFPDLRAKVQVVPVRGTGHTVHRSCRVVATAGEVEVEGRLLDAELASGRAHV